MAKYERGVLTGQPMILFGAIVLVVGLFSGMHVYASEEVSLDQQLIEAAEKGQSDRVAELLRDGADVNSSDSAGTTALTLAVTNNHDVVVDQLLDAGADITIRDYHGTNALQRALWLGNKAIILEKLLRAGADTEQTMGIGIGRWTPLMQVAAAGEDDRVAALLRAGANVEGSNRKLTPLMLASDRGHINIIGRLLEAGANAEVRNASNRTPIMEAAHNGDEATVRALLRGGARWPTKEEAVTAGVSEQGQQILESEINKYYLAIEKVLDTLPRDIKDIMYDQLGQRRISEPELRKLEREEGPPITQPEPEEEQSIDDLLESLSPIGWEELEGEIEEREEEIDEEELERAMKELQSEIG